MVSLPGLCLEMSNRRRLAVKGRGGRPTMSMVFEAQLFLSSSPSRLVAIRVVAQSGGARGSSDVHSIHSVDRYVPRVAVLGLWGRNIVGDRTCQNQPASPFPRTVGATPPPGSSLTRLQTGRMQCLITCCHTSKTRCDNQVEIYPWINHFYDPETLQVLPCPFRVNSTQAWNSSRHR